MDPEFLFRIEHDPAGVAPRLGLPDQRPRAGVAAVVLPVEQHSGRRAARSGEPEAAQRAGRSGTAGAAPVHDDPRARRALVENFAGQWLELRNIREHTPDPDIFDEFDENLRDAMRRETELFLESQLSEDRSVVELLNADYTFVNERLARHYGIPGVYGERFRRVTLGADQDHRRGLLGQASLLTVTSYPNRTSPVLRGKWVLGNILGAPPPPPPPDVNTR